MLAIFRKELKLYFSGIFGYAVTAILLLFMSLFFAVFHLMSGYADFSYTLSSMVWVLLPVIPVLCMRAIAEENQRKTVRLLYSLPLSLTQIVMGKFLAVATLFLLPTAVSALFPLILAGMGNPSLPSAYLALLGYVLMALAAIALCLFVGSLTEHKAIAAGVSAIVLLLVYFSETAAALLPTSALFSFLVTLLFVLGIGALTWRVSGSLTLGLLSALVLVLPAAIGYITNAAAYTALVPKTIGAIGIFARFSDFTSGYLRLPSVLFYLLFTAFFLFLTVGSMEKRRRA